MLCIGVRATRVSDNLLSLPPPHPVNVRKRSSRPTAGPVSPNTRKGVIYLLQAVGLKQTRIPFFPIRATMVCEGGKVWWAWV